MITLIFVVHMVSPGVLLRVLEVLRDQSKVLSHLQPQVRLRYPAIMGVDGMVLCQLLGNEPARWKRGTTLYHDKKMIKGSKSGF